MTAPDERDAVDDEGTCGVSGKAFMFSHATGKRIPCDVHMIGLRDRLLSAFGYVIRPCSLDAAFPDKARGRLCVEREQLTAELNGAKISSYHAVRCSVQDNGDEEYEWPKEVMKAAYAIDKAKVSKIVPAKKSACPACGGPVPCANEWNGSGVPPRGKHVPFNPTLKRAQKAVKP